MYASLHTALAARVRARPDIYVQVLHIIYTSLCTCILYHILKYTHTYTTTTTHTHRPLGEEHTQHTHTHTHTLSYLFLPLLLLTNTHLGLGKQLKGLLDRRSLFYRSRKAVSEVS
jgi:Ca2+/Na+ antiporter